jgi:hypothetical protein
MTLDTRTYRGASVEELLPQIREELGPDAIVVRRRDGIVGGIGGFFGRSCVELEAARRAVDVAAPVLALPPSTVAAAYAATAPAEEAVVPELGHDDPAPLASVLPVTFDEHLERAAVPAAPRGELGERIELADILLAAGVSVKVGEELVRRAAFDVRPFTDDDLATSARAVLTEALRTLPAADARRRTIVLAGLEPTGVVEVAASLARGYGRAGLVVGIVALAGLRSAAALHDATADARCRIALAEEPADVDRACARLGRTDVRLAIAPALDGADGGHAAAALCHLGRRRTHLVLPAGVSADEADQLHACVSDEIPLDALLPIDLDRAATVGGVLSLALERRLPIAWTATRGQVAPIDVGALVRRVVP